MKQFAISVIAAIAIAVGARAQTNSVPATNVTVVSTSPFNNVVQFIASNGEILPAGVGINLHGKVGETLAQQLDIIGGGGTNLWRVGLTLSTVFYGDVNQEELGLGATYEIRQAPAFLKKLLLVTTIPKELKIGAGIAEPLELYTDGWNHYDWKRTTFAVFGGWSF